MRKILLFLVAVLVILVGFSAYKYVRQRTVKNYLLVKVDFVDAPRLSPAGTVTLKLYKEEEPNKEIKSYFQTECIFIIDRGDYLLKLNYDDKEIIRKIHKSDDKEIISSFTLTPSKTMKKVNDISRFFGIFTLIFNTLLFYKFIYKSKRVINKCFHLLFFIMIFYNFFNFTNFFNNETLSKLQIYTELLLFLSLGIYFFTLFNSKFNSKKRRITIKILFSFFVIFHFLLFIYVEIFSNLAAFSYFLAYFYVMTIIIYIISEILKYSIFFIFAFIIFIKLKRTQNIILRKTLVYILSVLSSILIITVIFSVLRPPYYVRVDPVSITQIAMFFWLLFFESNIDAFLYIHKKYKNIIFYSFKIFIFFQIIYLYGLYMKNISIFAVTILIAIFLDVIYFLITGSIKNNNMFEDIYMKLKGVDDIEIFENIFEKEIMKNLPIESTQFKVFLNVEEITKYLENIRIDNVVYKENLKGEYKKFDFGIRLITEKDACIALLLIETKNENSEKEIIFLLADLMEKLSYVINYVRTLNLKKTLVESPETCISSETFYEEIMFIQKFASLIHSQTNEEKIKNYSEIILEKIEKLGEKND